ncbi:MAG: Uma2 family endonuclease [Isosphaeraceae bacterium]
MSTVERTRMPRILPPLENGQQLDQPVFHERYAAMPPETRAELVGGIVYMPSPMRLDHGKPSRFVAGWLFQYEGQTPGVEGADGATVKLDRKGEPQPDHLLLIPSALGGRSEVDDRGYVTGAPELVVEVSLSSRSYDLNQKKADYERAGVLEYVVVELDPNRIHWFIRRGLHFEDLPPGPDGIHRSETFPGLWLDGAALFAEDRSRLIRILKRGLRSPEHAAFVAKLAEARRRADHAK